jgi:hypothetical protein
MAAPPSTLSKIRTGHYCQAGHVGVQHQRLTPGVQCGDDPRLGAQILGGRQQGAQRITSGLQQAGRHPGDMGQPQRIEGMGQGEDHMRMIAG